MIEGRASGRTEPAQATNWTAQPGLARWGAHIAFWLVYFGVRSRRGDFRTARRVQRLPILINRALVVPRISR